MGRALPALDALCLGVGARELETGAELVSGTGLALTVVVCSEVMT